LILSDKKEAFLELWKNVSMFLLAKRMRGEQFNETMIFRSMNSEHTHTFHEISNLENTTLFAGNKMLDQKPHAVVPLHFVSQREDI
jgi:hypothetical protein